MPATVARSRYTPSHQAHALQSRNKQQLNTQRETATVIQGTAGRLYNQVINGLHFITQEEFSNRDFAITGGGCVQGAKDEAAA